MNGDEEENIEDTSPFPEDDSYEEQKIPIVIRGRCDIHVQADAGNHIACGGFWGKGLGTTVEEGIASAISGVRHNSRVYLTLLKEKRTQDHSDKKNAKRILGYSGKTEDLFKLIYFDYNKKEVEEQLGKYNRLEKIVKR